MGQRAFVVGQESGVMKCNHHDKNSGICVRVLRKKASTMEVLKVCSGSGEGFPHCKC